MMRLSIKTKLSAVIGILALGFIAFNAGYYPRRMERQIRAQAEMNARQVAESVGYALVPAFNSENAGSIPKVIEGLKNLPSYAFCAVFDDRDRRMDASSSVPAWVMKDFHRYKGAVRNY